VTLYSVRLGRLGLKRANSFVVCQDAAVLLVIQRFVHMYILISPNTIRGRIENLRCSFQSSRGKILVAKYLCFQSLRGKMFIVKGLTNS